MCKCCKSCTFDSGVNPGFLLLYIFLLFYPPQGAGHRPRQDAFFSDLEATWTGPLGPSPFLTCQASLQTDPGRQMWASSGGEVGQHPGGSARTRLEKPGLGTDVAALCRPGCGENKPPVMGHREEGRDPAPDPAAESEKLIIARRPEMHPR